jgi:hypothetical protein
VIVTIRRATAAGVFLFAATSAAPTYAQGYIGAFLVADVVRLDQYDSRIGDFGSGEALGFALRLGAEVGRRWGIELEFVRPGDITSDQTPPLLPALASVDLPGGVPPPASLANVSPSDLSVIFPSYVYQYRTTQRRTTLSTALWIRQEIARRFSLAYLGGVAFGRTENEVEVSYVPMRPTILPIPRSVNESIQYNVGPMVGVEGRIRMASQVDLVPGIRMHGIDSGWLIRPSLGLVWMF